MTQHQKTLKLLLMAQGICAAAFFILCALLALLVSTVFWDSMAGVAVGYLGGVFQIISMSYSVQKAVEQEAQSAQKYMLKHYVLRLLIMLGLLLFGVFAGRWYLLGVFLGLLCVKLGGFLAPKLEQILNK